METRSVNHALGTVQVPKQVKRLVVLDTAALDAAVAVGVKPIGSIALGDLPTYLSDKVSEITIVGQGNQPNLEAILSLQPDLILGNQLSSGSIYSQLTRIAPTVLTAGSGRAGEWRENFRLYARALGKTTEAERVLQTYQQCANQLRQQLENPEKLQISTVATGAGQIGFYSAKSFAGTVLADLGFDRPPTQAQAALHGGIISREDLDSIDGDAIFLITSAASSTSLDLQEFVADPLWSRLSAVRQGQVYAVEGEVWAAGRNVLAARQILKDVARAFLGSDISFQAELDVCLSETPISYVR
ncbi:MAG: iron-siderophore ABC transporter substrate-binding protein [Cyanobacteria bacterium J06641_5]